MPGGDLLADFDREDLEDAGHAGLDLEIVELTNAQVGGRLALVDLGFLRRDLRLQTGLRDSELLLGDVQPVLHFGGGAPELLQLQLGDQLGLVELFVGRERQVGLAEIGLGGGERGFLGEDVALEARTPVLERRLGGCEGEAGVHDLLLEVRIAHLQNHRRRRDLRTGAEHETLDPSGRRRGDPADVLGHEDAGTANLPGELTALDGVDPDRRAIDAGCRGPQPRDAIRHGADDDEADRGKHDAANLLLAFDFRGAGDIDHCKMPLS